MLGYGIGTENVLIKSAKGILLCFLDIQLEVLLVPYSMEIECVTFLFLQYQIFMQTCNRIIYK